ncbi:MAG: hypothetical protein J2P25_22665 [Nocardiopsaceae bacterium]|nr:hypothetical protein [Nocardiopsaceae bacterium]
MPVTPATTPSADTRPPPDEIALTEYKQIKAEQASRIGTRDNLLYATMVAIGAVIASSPAPARFLLIPPVTFILGWTYLANDHMITAIGRYVRDHPSLTGMLWETEHSADKRRRSRKATQLAVDLATFCGSGLVALIVFWLAPGPQAPLLLTASAIETLATGLLACQFVRYAELSNHQ